MPRPPKARLVAAVAMVIVAASCGSGPPPDVNTLLHEGKQSLDSAHSIHFHIDSTGTPSNDGAFIISGDGEVAHPNQFSGSMTISYSGLPLPLSMVATEGKFWIQRPFSTNWELADPNQYGFNDPAFLLDPNRGLSSLLISPTDIRLLSRDRLNGEELDEVSATVSGQRVTQVITGGDVSANFNVTFGVSVSSQQLRRVVISGPLVTKGLTSTYTCTFTDYDKGVTVTPPV